MSRFTVTIISVRNCEYDLLKEKPTYDRNLRNRSFLPRKRLFGSITPGRMKRLKKRWMTIHSETRSERAPTRSRGGRAASALSGKNH